jgi:hypothetical protein
MVYSSIGFDHEICRALVKLFQLVRGRRTEGLSWTAETLLAALPVAVGLRMVGFQLLLGAWKYSRAYDEGL